MSNPRAVEDRRKKVMGLLAKCITEEEIAKLCGVDQTTISKDIKALKIATQKYVYDLAKSDLAYEYIKSIHGMQEANKEAWRIYYESISHKTKLQALKVIGETSEKAFNLFSQGPSIMNVKALEERVNKIESRARERQIS
jgi:hypothetical protein